MRSCSVGITSWTPGPNLYLVAAPSQDRRMPNSLPTSICPKKSFQSSKGFLFPRHPHPQDYPPIPSPWTHLPGRVISTNRTLALTEDVFSLAVDGVEVSFSKLLPSTVCLPSSGMHFWSPPMVPGGLGGINQDNHPPQNEFREPGHFRPVTFKFVV